MLFNSIEFLVFLPISFSIYWVLNHHNKFQNIFLLICSYLFYSFWDYRFLSLIILSTIIDYVSGQKIYNSNNIRFKKIWLFLSIFTNLSILCTFKYFNFFLDSFYDFLSLFNFYPKSFNLEIILPVGISFYTFQTMSYTIDIYKNKLRPTDSIINFATFVSYFPQLVAGPIERASSLLPQIESKKKFDYLLAKKATHKIIYGLFKKIVVADNLALIIAVSYTHLRAQET